MGRADDEDGSREATAVIQAGAEWPQRLHEHHGQRAPSSELMLCGHHLEILHKLTLGFCLHVSPAGWGGVAQACSLPAPQARPSTLERLPPTSILVPRAASWGGWGEKSGVRGPWPCRAGHGRVSFMSTCCIPPLRCHPGRPLPPSQPGDSPQSQGTTIPSSSPCRHRAHPHL